MALSIDFDPSMRSPIIPEARSAFSESGVIFERDSSLSQAVNMGKLGNVEITPQDALLYKSLREKEGSLKSDQALMAEDVLTGEKSAQFKKAFPHIFSPLH